MEKNTKLSFDFTPDEVKVILSALTLEIDAQSDYSEKASAIKADMEVWYGRVQREVDGNDIAHLVCTSLSSYTKEMPNGATNTDNYERITNMFNEISEIIEVGNYLFAESKLLNLIKYLWKHEAEFYNLDRGMERIIQYTKKYIPFPMLEE